VSALALPESLIARFRALAFERLERIDGAWTALTHEETKADEETFRELHTLKGEARVVGFAEVGTLCQKLEDLFEEARRCRYRVGDDVDVVVTMAIQFAGMLLRKTNNAGGVARGIDLDAFLARVDAVLADSVRRPPSSAQVQVHEPHLRVEAAPAGPAASRSGLTAAATAVYLESLRATGAARLRLHAAWEALVRGIADLDALPVAPVLATHVEPTKGIAEKLAKEVDVVIAAGDLRVGPDALDALNTGVLHALRNAVDHGIDSPEERDRAGKSPVGVVRVDVGCSGDLIEVEVTDDGAGVDFASVKLKAAKLGLPARRELEELLFEPGFSTRDRVTETSGRGVGLDAVRAAVRRLGGQVRIESGRGRGTTLYFSLWNRCAPVDVNLFQVPGGPIPFAIDASWAMELAPGAAVADLLVRLELAPLGPRGSGRALAFARGARRLVLTVDDTPAPAIAIRFCPPTGGTAVEVVSVDGAEALLIDPEALFGPGAR
jgi:two-component system chemotaxis sensor kinase CheA